MPSRTLALGLALSALSLLPACSRPNPPAENAAGGQEQTSATPRPSDQTTQDSADIAEVGSGVAAQPLVGSTWVLVDIGGTEPLDGVQATLEFPEMGKVAGRGSCNRFFGNVQINGDTMALSPLGSTRMACPDALMKQEAKYLQALEKATRYKIDGSSLMIFVKGMDKPLRFMQH